MEKEKLAALLLICLVALLTIYYYAPRRLTLIAVSKIEIQPTGLDNPQTEEVEGYYWVITAATDMTDEIGAVKLENNTEGTIEDKKLVTTSEITIKIDPHRPYWEIPVTWEPVTVYPKTYQGWGNKPSLGSLYGRDENVYVSAKTLKVYRFARDYWEAHTPFTVYIYKNNKLIGSKYIDTTGGTETVTIENPDDSKEKAIITNLGKIGSAYQISIGKLAFISSLTYAYSEEVVNQILKYDKTERSFSAYWFGPPEDDEGHWTRWKDDDSPAGLWFDQGGFGNIYVYDIVHAPGWEDKSDWVTWINKPKAASFDDIISYIENYYSRQNVDLWGQGAEITSSGNLRVYMPFGAMSSLITIKVSSELADTIVWHPPTANLKIVDYTTIGDVGDRFNFMVKVKQESTVRSTGKISMEITPPDAPASIVPEYVSPTLDPGEEATFYFTFINLGTDQKISGTVNVVCTELVTGAVTDKVSISYSLLPRAEETATLEVYTIDKATGEKVSGIPTTIKWDTQSDLKYTDEGVALWDMNGFTGTVFISTGETATYKSTSTSTTLHTGINTVTLYLEKKGPPTPPPIPEWVIYVAVASIIAVAIIASAYIIRRR